MSLTEQRPRVLVPGLNLLDPGVERYLVRGGAATVVSLLAGDTVTVHSPAGAQPCDIAAFGADGRSDRSLLGIGADAPATTVGLRVNPMDANPDEVHQGGDNLRKQLENMQIHGVTPVVAINVFPGDHDQDLTAIHEIAAEYGARAATTTHFTNGGAGAAELATAVAEATEEPSNFNVLYPDNMSIKDKILTVATKVYGAANVEYTPTATKQIDNYEQNGFGNLPVCIAKTHLSTSHDPKLKGAPTGFTLPVREVRASVGAGFVYPLCGDMRTMPGLGKNPAAHHIDIDTNGNTQNLS